MNDNGRQPKFTILFLMTFLLCGCAVLLSKPASTLPGTMEGRLEVKNKQRSYRVHLPKAYRLDKPLPMVVVLHGAFGSAREVEKVSGFSELADKEDFIVVYPNGIGLLGFLRHWNAGFCCGRAMRAGWNDSGFLLQLIDTLSAQLAVDRQRIYMLGISNGGMMAQRFAAEHADRLAAVTLAAAAVGAQWQGQAEMLTAPRSPWPVPALIIHARDDPMIPFESGQSQSRSDVTFLGPQDAVIYWRDANACAPTPTETVRMPGGDWTLWSDCLGGAEVALMAVDHGGHEWPARPSAAVLSEQSPDWAETAWCFMSRFTRP